VIDREIEKRERRERERENDGLMTKRTRFIIVANKYYVTSLVIRVVPLNASRNMSEVYKSVV
jgi:hypothetical protein